MSSTPHRQVTIALPTLGCKANRYDSDTLARALIARGYIIVAPSHSADVYIVNTCTVTGEADAKSRKLLRRALRLNAGARVIVTGCYASLKPDALAAIDGVDAVIAIPEQERIPSLVESWFPPLAPAGETDMPHGLSASVERTRAIVKVQDGCNLRCAFCAVTLARGDVRSRPIADIIAELQELAAAGIREIVLTGIRLDAYGLDLHGQRLADLIDATRDVEIARLRLSSLEPVGIDDRLVERLAAHPALCHHFHVCLQSGDDGVLRAMRRGYTAARYRAVITRLRDAMTASTLTTDLIVGFPGETDDAFARTCAFVEEIGFIKLHVFPFSPRPGTEAAGMSWQVSESVKAARGQALQALAHGMFQQYARELMGMPVSVLVERTGAHGDGLTAQYVRVCAPFAAADAGTIRTVRVNGYGRDFLLASPD